MFSFALAMPLALANPDPVNVAWYVTDSNGDPLNGAQLTIYWATSASGPFTVMPADMENTYVLDRVAGIKQNPIVTGYWNPTYPDGMANSDVHPANGLSGLYFYVTIEYGALTWYWPVADSIKPGDPTWVPVPATGSPSGYAADGPGIGTGVTTAYPTRHPPPPPSVPELSLATYVAISLGMVSLVAAQRVFRRKRR